MAHPHSVARVAPSSSHLATRLCLQSLMTDALRKAAPEKRETGKRASWRVKDVAREKLKPCLLLQQILDERIDRGVDVEKLCESPRALELYIRGRCAVRDGRTGDVREVVTAFQLEEEAQGVAGPLQFAAAQPNPAPGVLERCMAALLAHRARIDDAIATLAARIATGGMRVWS